MDKGTLTMESELEARRRQAKAAIAKVRRKLASGEGAEELATIKDLLRKYK